MTRTPVFWGYPLLPHDYPFYWVKLDPKSKEDKVKVTNLKNSLKFQKLLIRCANMKWIQRVLLKIQSGHDSVHRQTDRRTDGQTDKVKPVYLPFNFVEAGGITSLTKSLLMSLAQPMIENGTWGLILIYEHTMHFFTCICNKVWRDLGLITSLPLTTI